MCFVKSTSQGRILQSLLSFTIWHCLFLFVMRADTPRPQVFEQGLQEVVWVTQFLFESSFRPERPIRRYRWNDVLLICEIEKKFLIIVFLFLLFCDIKIAF